MTMQKACPKCGVPAGTQCVYTSKNNIHRDPVTHEYVWNVVGETMLKEHSERR